MNHTAAAAAAAVAHNVGLTRSSRRTKWQMITANRDAGATFLVVVIIIMAQI